MEKKEMIQYIAFTMPGRAWTTDEVISECISVIDQISKED